MGRPVSPVVANLCMEIIEKTAITASSTPPKIWKRYVDDSFVIIKKHSVASFHDTLNCVVLEKPWNPGSQQLRTMLTILRKNYKDNIQFYFEPHISIFTRIQTLLLFLLQFCFFTLFIDVRAPYLLLVKDYRLVVESTF